MRAIIVQEKVFDSVMEAVRRRSSGGYLIKRLIIPDAENLQITPHSNGRVYTSVGFDLTREGCQVIGETDVPDHMVEKALTLAKAKQELDGLKDQFDALLT